jgi:hypothetical protein
MNKTIFTKFGFLLFYLAFLIQIVEAQEDYSYVLGVWESKLRNRQFVADLAVKEIRMANKTAVVSLNWPEQKSFEKTLAAGSYEIKNALFIPGIEPVIEFISPISGSEITYKFNKNGLGTFKAVSKRGGEFGTEMGTLKRK